LNHEERKREQACSHLLAAAKDYAKVQAEIGWIAPIQYCFNTETEELVVYAKDETVNRKLLEFIKTL
jgi:hypothetical protein